MFGAPLHEEAPLARFFARERSVHALTYLARLQQQLLPFLQQQDSEKGLYLQQDGAPADYATLVRTWLGDNQPGQWIGRQGPS